MRFGIAFANTGPFATPDGAAAMAEAAEQAGFDSLWTVEHVVVPKQYASVYPYSPERQDAGGRRLRHPRSADLAGLGRRPHRPRCGWPPAS